MSKSNPFKGFHSGPEVVRLAVMLYVRFPLSLRNVEDLLHEVVARFLFRLRLVGHNNPVAQDIRGNGLDILGNKRFTNGTVGSDAMGRFIILEFNISPKERLRRRMTAWVVLHTVTLALPSSLISTSLHFLMNLLLTPVMNGEDLSTSDLDVLTQSPVVVVLCLATHLSDG